MDRPNFEAAQEEFRRRGIVFEFQDHDAAHSIYFNDPDGLRLELTTYDVQQGIAARTEIAPPERA